LYDGQIPAPTLEQMHCGTGDAAALFNLRAMLSCLRRLALRHLAIRRRHPQFWTEGRAHDLALYIRDYKRCKAMTGLRRHAVATNHRPSAAKLLADLRAAASVMPPGNRFVEHPPAEIPAAPPRDGRGGPGDARPLETSLSVVDRRRNAGPGILRTVPHSDVPRGRTLADRREDAKTGRY
jgi:hypothetical protein